MTETQPILQTPATPRKVYHLAARWRVLALLIPVSGIVVLLGLALAAWQEPPSIGIAGFVTILLVSFLALDLTVAIYIGLVRVRLVTSPRGIVLYSFGTCQYIPWDSVVRAGTIAIGTRHFYGLLVRTPGVRIGPWARLLVGTRPFFGLLSGWYSAPISRDRLAHAISLGAFVRAWETDGLGADVHRYAPHAFRTATSPVAGTSTATTPVSLTQTEPRSGGKLVLAFAVVAAEVVATALLTRVWSDPVLHNGLPVRTLPVATSLPVDRVAVSPDGRTLASSAPHQVRLWRVSDGQLLRTLDGSGGVAFAPDGQTLATGTDTGTVRLWHIANGALVRTLHAPLDSDDDMMTDVDFSPDGRTLAAASRFGMVLLWHVGESTTGRVLKHITDQDAGQQGIVTFASEGRTLAAVSGGYGRVWMWRASDASLVYSLPQDLDGTSIALTPDGAFMALGQRDGSIQLWRIADGSLVTTLHGHSGPVTSLAFSPDGLTLASGSSDTTVRVWKRSDGRLLHTLWGHTDRVESLAYTPDGRTLASSADDGTVLLWTLAG